MPLHAEKEEYPRVESPENGQRKVLREGVVESGRAACKEIPELQGQGDEREDVDSHGEDAEFRLFLIVRGSSMKLAAP